MIIVPQCYRCKNFIGDSACLAFPQGVPEVILMGINDHSEPFEGDGGIQFEDVEGKENE